MFAVTVGVVAFPVQADAATITVTILSDVVDATDGEVSLREAVDQANATPGADTIVLGSGTYTLSLGPAGDDANVSGDLDHTDPSGDLTITGAGQGATVITTSLADRIFHMTTGTLTLADVTISGGRVGPGAGILTDGGGLTASDVTFDDNTASGTNLGGAGYISGPLSATRVTLTSNSAEYGGGFFAASTGDVTSASATNNSARVQGGAFYFTGSSSVGGSDFVGNSALLDGGAIASFGPSMDVSGSTFTGNDSGRYGGAVFSSSSLTFTDSSASGNDAGWYAGAVWLNGGGTITGSTFDNNTGGFAVGAVGSLGHLHIENSTVTRNSSPIVGGLGSLATLTAVHLTAVDNSAPTAANLYANTLSVTASVFGLPQGGGADCFFGTPPTSGGGNFDSDGSCGLTDPSDISSGGDPGLSALASNGGPTMTMKPIVGSQLIDLAPVGPIVDQRGVSRPSGGASDAGAFELQIPTAVPDDPSTDEDTAVVIDVIANDIDPDGIIDPANAVATTAPSNGTTSDNGDGTITYTPDPDWFGTDSFTYSNGFTTALVSVTVDSVNDAPTAVDDVATVDEDVSVNIDATGNDSDPEDDPITIEAITAGPSNGSAAIEPDNTITYVPHENFNGVDQFTYEIRDGNGGSDVATVDVTVQPVNDAPALKNGVPPMATVAEDGALVIAESDYFEDVDGDPVDAIAIGDAANGETALGSILYTPNANFNGGDSFMVTVADGQGGTLEVQFAIEVTPVNDMQVVQDETHIALQGETVVIDVLANDIDIDGDPMTLSIESVSVGNAEVLDNRVQFTSPEDYVGQSIVVYNVTAAGVTVQGTLTVFVEKGLPFTGFEMPALAIGALIMILGGSLTLRRVGWR